MIKDLNPDLKGNHSPKIEAAIKSLVSRGFKLSDQAERPYRFTIAVFEKGGQKFFVKIAEKGVVEFKFLRAEVWCNQIFQELLADFSNPPPVKIPKVLDQNESSDIYWVMFEFFAGERIADWVPSRDPRSLKDWFPQIVDFVQFLEVVDPEKLETIEEVRSDVSVAEKMLAKINKWSAIPLKKGLISQDELKVAIDLVGELGDGLEYRLQHGDFVPWHMHDLGFPFFGLVDSEHGGVNQPQYYDLAYFYHRLYTKLWQPQLARDFLSLYLRSSNANREKFLKKFLPVIVQRTIGGFWDYSQSSEEKREFGLHSDLLKRVLSKDLDKLIN